MTARFSIDPLEGRPPPYLEPHDVCHRQRRYHASRSGGAHGRPGAHEPAPARTRRPGSRRARRARHDGQRQFAHLDQRPARDRRQLHVHVRRCQGRPSAARRSTRRSRPLIPCQRPDPGARSISRSPAALAAIFAGTAFSGGRRRLDRARRTGGARRTGSRCGSAARPSIEPRRSPRTSQSRAIADALADGAVLRHAGAPSWSRPRRAIGCAGAWCWPGGPTNQHYTRFVATKAGPRLRPVHGRLLADARRWRRS